MAVHTHARTVGPRPKLFRDTSGFDGWRRAVEISDDIQEVIESKQSQNLIPVLNKLIRSSFVRGERPQFKVPQSNEDYAYRLNIKQRQGLFLGGLSLIGVELLSDQYPNKDEIIPGPEVCWARGDSCPIISMPIGHGVFERVYPEGVSTAPYWTGLVKAIGTAEAAFTGGQTELLVQQAD